MKELSKKLLNYYAAFTETKFNFSRLITYRWSDNELSLDLGIYESFTPKLLELSVDKTASSVSVKKGEYTIKIEANAILNKSLEVIKSDFGIDYINSCIETQKQSKASVFISGSEGNQEVQEAKQESEIASEAFRVYNLALRKQIDAIITELHRNKINDIKEKSNTNRVPASTFNQRTYTQKIFDALQETAKNITDAKEYYEAVNATLKNIFTDITLYDLFFSLYDYHTFAGMGTLYAFFHDLKADKYSFPLYFVELEMRIDSENETIEISVPMNITLINTPAVNLFKFEKVLTLPRSSTREQAHSHISALQMYLQAEYGVNESFLSQSSFTPVLAEDEEKPSIHPRIGLQVIKNEDKKLLDYSEIHAKIDSGKKSQFTNFVSQYIEGKIPNYQEETDQTFKQQYPLTSPNRYVHESPLPLNASQKRILTAVQNPNNKAIVVDGPPGTGKSHTIAAISYWANKNQKSLVITSHKKEALDVIERMLEKKFKEVHPHAKPSILRLSSNTTSHNSITNTLASPVIVAATDRSLESNVEAIKSDFTQQQETITKEIQDKINAQKNYQEYLYDQLTLEQISNKIGLPILNSAPKSSKYIDFSLIKEAKTNIENLHGVSVNELSQLIAIGSNSNEILQAIEVLHTNKSLDSINSEAIVIPEALSNLISELQESVQLDIPIAELDPDKHLAGGRISKIKNRNKKPHIKQLINEMLGLKYSAVLQNIAKQTNTSSHKLTLADINTIIQSQSKVSANIKQISIVKNLLNNSSFTNLTPEESYTKLQTLAPIIVKINAELPNQINLLSEQYTSVLKEIGFNMNDVSLVSAISEDLFNWLELHNKLSLQSVSLLHDALTGVDNYLTLNQKIIENINDDRLKRLNTKVAEVSQIKQRYENGRRFTEEQARILLDNIAVIIAEPAMISKYFPMQEELFDTLVIDEASQVSIADSISVMLRAKQVVVFGDEYQYGAVSAQTVSTKYSSSYFKEIIDAYKDEYKVGVSAQAEEALLKDIQKEQTDDDLVPEITLRPSIDQGTIDWLKTFNIRTSTLSFTKAIANYSTSLKEHFRSFPEIISYSNEIFYRPAQLELVVNRIRTQPITQTLVFKEIQTQGKAGANINLDEIIFIAEDIKKRIANGFKGTIGIITSFREQQIRTEEYLREHFNYRQLQKDHDLAVWFVRDVQGEERDIVYYSFVEDKKLGNADLKTIYPVVGGTADNPRSIKMQQLNVGFSRAKDTMVFVHSQPISDFSATRLGDAIKFYKDSLEQTQKADHYIADINILESEQEKFLYKTLINTQFYAQNKGYLHIVPQFEIGKYIKAEFHAQIPKYRCDFLVTHTKDGKQKSIIIEYDGIEFHYKNPSDVTAQKFSQEYTEYDIARQLELESYGYKFLRINKFSLRPDNTSKTEADMLDELLKESFAFK